jgi:signal transduction histidine kinase
VVRAAKEAARSLGAEERLDVEPAEEPVMVWASVAPLELSVGNLVRNAIEASPADGRIRFSVDLFPEWAEIVVEDSGPGLPNESEDRIFEPFFTTKNDRGGTGLGLAITRDMIAQLGGEVEIENLADGGARATIRLQRWQEPEQSS